MQTITIAVSAIVIAAGFASAPGYINAARENVMRSDLANFGFVMQEYYTAHGKLNTDVDPKSTSEGRLNQGKFIYDFNESSWEPNSFQIQFCYRYHTGPSAPGAYPTDFVAQGSTRTGKTYFISSSTLKPVLDRAELNVPASCQEGYVPPSGTPPVVVDNIAAPTAPASGISTSASKDSVSWNAAVCSTGTLPVYQVRATRLNGSPSNLSSPGWTSSKTITTDFLQGQNVSGDPYLVIAAKCRSALDGALSNSEALTSEFRLNG